MRASFYNVKIRVKLSALLLIVLTGCTATYATPKKPWRVEVKTSGGLAGRGTGDYAIDSEGNVTARLFNGQSCSFKIDPKAIETLLAKARPGEWKASYVPENPCCDRIEYVLTYDQAGDVVTTKWIDDPLPMPADLVALSQAIVGGEASSLRMQSTERCK